MIENTKPTPIQNEIARQIAVQKPAHLRPGIDVGFRAVVDEDSGSEGIAVHVVTDNTLALVMYDAGRDTYVMVRKRHGEAEPTKLDDVYVDQLGELIFGTDASAFNEPLVQIWTEGDDGEWSKVGEF